MKTLKNVFLSGVLLAMCVAAIPLTQAHATPATLTTVSGTILPGSVGQQVSVLPATGNCLVVNGGIVQPNGSYSVQIVCSADGATQLIVGGLPTGVLFNLVGGTPSTNINAVVNSPTITSLFPNFGPASGGNVLQISGSGFIPGNTQVVFNSAPVVIPTVVNPNTLTVTVPAGIPGSVVQVRVATANGVSPINAPVTSYSYQFLPPPPPPPMIAPIVYGLSAQRGMPGDVIIVYGANFLPNAGVYFDGVGAFTTFLSVNQLRVVVPLGNAYPAQVRVSTTQGNSVDAGPVDDFYFAYPTTIFAPPTQTPTPPPPPPPTPVVVAKTINYTLNFRWSLVGYAGQTLSLRDVTTAVPEITAVYYWDASNQEYLGYFPSAEGFPGANRLFTLDYGKAYWIAVSKSVVMVANQGP